MTRPGFRKGTPGGSRATGAAPAPEGFLSGSLFSQTQILHLMKAEFARARRHGIPLSCILLQVDRLAQLVDLHGAGLRQTVRQTLAQMVQEKTRGADLLGALSDDRYLLVLPHTTLGQARIVAGRLSHQFQSVEVAVEGKVLALDLAFGIAACEDQQTMFFDSMVAQAESALEFAMRRGGDRIASFDEAHLFHDEPPQQAPEARA